MTEQRKPNAVMCSRCLHSWIGFYLPLPIGDAARIMKNLTCPNCAATAKDIYVGESARKRGASTVSAQQENERG